MDADTLLKGIEELPLELRLIIVEYRVKSARSISLTNGNTEAEIGAILAPFAHHFNLLTIAQTIVQRVNTYTIFAQNTTITWNAGVPSIVSQASGQNLTYLPDIRTLEIVVPNTLQGADWNSPPASAVTLPTATTALLDVLPTVFPRLDSVTVKVVNVGLIAPGATYQAGTQIITADNSRVSRAREKVARMLLLVAAVHHSRFTRWRQGDRVQRRLVFVQRLQAGAPGYEGPRRVVHTIGTTSHAATNGTRWFNVTRMWKLCDWPRIDILF